MEWLILLLGWKLQDNGESHPETLLRCSLVRPSLWQELGSKCSKHVHIPKMKSVWLQ